MDDTGFLSVARAPAEARGGLAVISLESWNRRKKLCARGYAVRSQILERDPGVMEYALLSKGKINSVSWNDQTMFYT